MARIKLLAPVEEKDEKPVTLEANARTPLNQTHFKNRVTKIILPASLYLTAIGSMNFREATVRFENTKLGVAQLEYDIKQVDPKIIQKAAQEIKIFTGKTLKTTKATRVKSKMKEV
ncbi:hypothetical protein [Brevibacillus sp. SKDU10]|uniref:hypothetical protein n=1 Tax=Brevibacillus sp. SKDU10 TaxID=1247872 RepID=UPI0012F964B4|nr:hypothetical protein [Brevibacillus sp. SKDU10]